ncbi:hypothetical protein TRFO_37694 [Tritrichomonas foetus]|uniref:Uncharacterized protein n=1 Tax=Tritrichomonas foetus TaxID=1144522 RepID=A0A1J4JAD4_9EUKA|nr:hypothetical protein TRFO_37694 [Tritrichomonas foetus]|eukprot:OHS96138.1 hypothetical protein TRFO_37694 [Tritrichomonas foetus]
MKANGENLLQNAFPGARPFPNPNPKYLYHCVGLENCLIFASPYEKNDSYSSSTDTQNLQNRPHRNIIYVAKQEQNEKEDHFFPEPQKIVEFTEEKIIKMLSITEKLIFSSFYVFILTRSTNDKKVYKMYLLNEHFESSNSTIVVEFKINDFFEGIQHFDLDHAKIVDFAISSPTNVSNYISLAFIVKIKANQNNNPSTSKIAKKSLYFAFFRSFNENKLEKSFAKDLIIDGMRINKPLLFTPLTSTSSQNSNYSQSDEIPKQIQLRPPYFIFFKQKKFHIVLLSSNNFITRILNEYPLRQSFCQFVGDDSALFVFNEIVSIVDFKKQSNATIHIISKRLANDTFFYLHDETLYFKSNHEIFKISINSNRVSDGTKIIEKENFEQAIKSVSSSKTENLDCRFLTIACNNIIVRMGNNGQFFFIAKPMNIGTFAAQRLITTGNRFDCITLLDNQPKNIREQAYNECFVELWKQGFPEKALAIASTRHAPFKPCDIISLFEIFEFDTPLVSENKYFHKLEKLSKEDNNFSNEIYRRLNFYLIQCRDRYLEKDIQETRNIIIVETTIIEYLIISHKHKDLIAFLDMKQKENFQNKTDIYKNVSKFFKSHGKNHQLYIENALFEDNNNNEKAIKMLKIISKILDKSENPNDFSPEAEAVKILKKILKNKLKNKNDLEKLKEELKLHDWIFLKNPKQGIQLFLPNNSKQGNDFDVDLDQLKALLESINNDTMKGDHWLNIFYYEWIKVEKVDQKKKLKLATELMKGLKSVQFKINQNKSGAEQFLLHNSNELLWLESLAQYGNIPANQKTELYQTILEEAIKEIQSILKNTIILMKQNPEYESFKNDKEFNELINIQDIDFKKEMKWLTEKYDEAIELESEGTTSEATIIALCQKAINPAEAFKSYDQKRKDFLGKNSEWKDKIEYVALSDVIASIPDNVQLEIAAPFFISAISLMTARIHHLEERVSLEKTMLIEERMWKAHEQIMNEDASISKEKWKNDS